MGYIYYQLNNSANFATLAPAALGGGAYGFAFLPPTLAGAGMYIIINCQGAPANHNRYIGISSNLAKRFGPRMSVITECGFTAAVMANIHCVWGAVRVRNHPFALGVPTTLTPIVPPRVPPNVAFPNWAAGGWTAPPVPAGGAYTTPVDGNLINLEHLLVRFVMMRLGTGGTVSNNQLMVPFNHPSALGAAGAQPIIVKFESPAFGPYPAFAEADILNPGFVW
jgi:hypothetical protein